ncbi:hypothetical protein V5O48_016591, partial [Marasmius crinis-equi]
EIVLATDIPTTVKGVNARSRCFAYIPCLLGAPPDKKALLAMTRSFPDLRPLLTEALCKVVEECHPIWRLWAHMLYAIKSPTAPNDDIAPEFRGKIYHEGPELGLIFARHLHHEAHLLATIPVEKIPDIWALLICLTPRELFRHAPLAHSEVLPHSVPALISVISALLKRKKIRRGTAENDERKAVHNLVVLGWIYLAAILVGYTSALIALNAGVVPMLLKTPMSLFLRDTPKSSLAQEATSTIEIIDSFLIYPRILHAFLRSIQGFSDPMMEEIEAGMKMGSVTLWQAWDRAKSKALRLREFRRELKKNPSFLCCSPVCPLKDAKTPEWRTSHYSVCSQCQAAYYCSVECQRMEWQIEHRGNCLESREKAEIKSPSMRNPENELPISDYEHQFTDAWIGGYLGRYAQEILDRISMYCSQLSRATEDERLVKSGDRTPILVLDLTTFGIEPPKKIIHTTIPALVKKDKKLRRYRDHLAGLAEMWRGDEVGQGKVLLVTLFPRGRMAPWISHKVIDLPTPNGVSGADSSI